MKSGPVFLWRGSVALLCEACQRLMIRWNIQTPATRRQANWYVLIPDRGPSHADLQIFMHVHVLVTLTHTVHAHTLVCIHTYTPPSLQRPWFTTRTWDQGYTQQNEEKKSDRERFRPQTGYWFLLCAGRWREKNKLHERDFPLALMNRL